MLNMIKKTWNNTLDKAVKNRQQLALASIFAVSLTTFNVVFPAAILPTLVTLATLTMGLAIYFVGKAIVSFSHEENTLIITEKDATEVPKENSKGSAAGISKVLRANKTKEASKEKEAEDTIKPIVKDKAKSTVNDQENEIEQQEQAAFRF